MIGNSKPTASLTSGLLARKGQARPAMRPQGFMGLSPSLDDLGWNDMGEGNPAPAAQPSPAVPPVLQQRQVLAEAVKPEPEAKIEAAPKAEAAPVVEPAPVAEVRPLPKPAARAANEVAPRAASDAAAKKAKAAFTLRLDIERHLRLRLASAVTRQSSQQLVTQALDRFLDSLPEVEDLAHQVPKREAHG